jgi:dTDP-4-dehydrorhamnose reductase
MQKRILITGSGGQLGNALVQTYPEATAVNRSMLDISDAKQVKDFDWSSYDVIINAAAYVNADHSETTEGREMTWSANAIGPRNLAQVALEHDLHLIHISSEYVYDGRQENIKEDYPFAPLSVYGQTKAAADIVVGLLPKYHILRTTWVVGEGHNFVKTMARLAELRIDPKVVNDQFGRLTFTQEITRAVDHILKKNIAYGTYNMSNSGKIKSWADIAADTFEIAGYDRNRVTPITTDDYKEDKQPFAPRPVHSDLDLTKIQATGFVSQDYGPMLVDYVKNLKNEGLV